jgi:hypothetical protein
MITKFPPIIPTLKINQNKDTIMEKKLKGFKTYRHSSNPKEKELHDTFTNEFSERDMDYVVFGHLNSSSGAKPDDTLSEREQRIVVSVIQWLSSPVGTHFLRSVGYCEEKEFLPRERLFSAKIACLEQQLAKIPLWIKTLFK